MGAIVSYFNNFFTKREVRILVLGLDNAGKTTVLYALQLGEPIKTEPTYGFNCEIISYKNLNFRVFDLSGETFARPYWSCFFQNTDAIIYVVDSTDKFRMEICRRELFFMLEKKELEKAVLVVLANKQDIPTALTLPEIFEELGLVLLRDRTFRIFETSAIEGKGVEEAMEWLISKLAVNESIWDKFIKL